MSIKKLEFFSHTRWSHYVVGYVRNILFRNLGFIRREWKRENKVVYKLIGDYKLVVNWKTKTSQRLIESYTTCNFT